MNTFHLVTFRFTSKPYFARMFGLAILILAGLTLTSCESSIAIKANKDASTEIQVQADVGTIVYNTIKAVSSGMGEISSSATGQASDGEAAAAAPAKEEPVFSAKEIGDSLAAGDMTNVSVSTPTISSISVYGKLPAPANQTVTLKNNNAKVANFVACTKNSLTLILSPSTMYGIAASLPEDAKSYLDLLMAPVFSGETMSPSDYIDLVATVYGQELSDELQSSAVKITLSSPEGTSIKKTALSDATNVKTAADQVTFLIPLAEFLTLSDTKTFSITW